MFKYEKVNDNVYDVFVDSNYKTMRLGCMMTDDAGYFMWWPDQNGQGAWGRESLKELANKLDELNKDWDEEVERELAKLNSGTM